MRMKTRDKLKYGLASILALATCAAIGAMVVAKQRREQVPPEERARIARTLKIYGSGERAENTTQHGATLGDPAAQP